MKSPALFLDRDGTINHELDFLTNPDQIHLLPGVPSALRTAMALGFKLFIITNQSGIARGFLSENRLKEIHGALLHKLNEEHITVDRIYYCPHHPDIGELPYRKDCDCRKPKTGMIKRAAQEFHLDLKKSFVIGDKMIDVQTGASAGIPSILVLTGYGKAELELCREEKIAISYIAGDLPDAVRHIQQTVHQSQSTCSS